MKRSPRPHSVASSSQKPGRRVKDLGQAHPPGLALVVLICCATTAAGCGSRTVLLSETAETTSPPTGTCMYDADCTGSENRCVVNSCRDRQCVPTWMVDCDDHDPCTKDECVAATGACSHEPATPDLDGDGHRAPLPGLKAGESGSCGDDCNDGNAAAHPGAREICDGVDNDCNDIVDDQTSVSPDDGLEVRISLTTESASPEGLAFANSTNTYLVSYSAYLKDEGLDAVFVAPLDRVGALPAPAIRFTHVGANSYAGPVVWTGDRFATLWADRRNSVGNDPNYEIYFNEMTPTGEKFGADVRLTDMVGFSVGPTLAWTGTGFAAAWQDSGPSGDVANQILGRRLSLDGQPLEPSRLLVDEGNDGQEAPVLVTGPHTLGIAWMRGDSGVHRIEFGTFHPDFGLVGGPVTLTTRSRQGVAPSLAYGALGYSVAWYDPDVTHQTPIFGAVVDEQGKFVVEPKPITETPRHSRFPSILGYGDRVLLVWSDDKDDNDGYEIYAKLLDSRLNAASSEMRVSHGRGDSMAPVAAFGPSGDVGIVFRDDRDASPQAYFARLRCVAAK